MDFQGPLWSAIDRVVVSPPGVQPPPMGAIFPEQAGSRDKRRKEADSQFEIDLDSTYSMSFKTSNLDIIDWNVVNIPLLVSGFYLVLCKSI